MRYFVIVLSLLAGGLSLAMAQEPSATAAPDAVQEVTDAPAEQPASFWMDQKLRYSQQILAALARGDFDALESSARDIRSLNRIESFVRRNPPAYRRRLEAFQSANEELVRAARKHNLEAAALAFKEKNK